MSDGMELVVAILLALLVVGGNAFVLMRFRKNLKKLKERINR